MAVSEGSKNPKNRIAIILFFTLIVFNGVIFFALKTTESAFYNLEKGGIIISFAEVTDPPEANCSPPEMNLEVKRFRYREHQNNEADLTGAICIQNWASEETVIESMLLRLYTIENQPLFEIPVDFDIQPFVQGQSRSCYPFDILLQGISVGTYHLQSALELKSRCEWNHSPGDCGATFCAEKNIQLLLELSELPTLPPDGTTIDFQASFQNSNQVADEIEVEICVINQGSTETENLVIESTFFHQTGNGLWIPLSDLDFGLEPEIPILAGQKVCFTETLSLGQSGVTEIKNIIRVGIENFLNVDNPLMNMNATTKQLIWVEKTYLISIDLEATATVTNTKTCTATQSPTFTMTPARTIQQSLPTLPPIPTDTLATELTLSPTIPTPTATMTLPPSDTPIPTESPSTIIPTLPENSTSTPSGDTPEPTQPPSPTPEVPTEPIVEATPSPVP